MNDDLYFIPILAKALSEPARREALRTSFERVEALGRQPRFRQGHTQFRRFMAQVAQAQRLDSWRAIADPVTGITQTAVTVTIDNSPLGTAALSLLQPQTVLPNLSPGHLRLKLDTGLVLWEGSVHSEDVLWGHVELGQPLPLAAAKVGPGARPSRTVMLENQGLRLRFYAGLELGSVELTLMAEGM